MAKKKIRKMLGNVNASSTITLMHLIETQSKATIAKWSIDYAENKMLPLFLKYCPEDDRPGKAIKAAREWLDGKVKLPVVKKIILNECHAAARELDENPIAQAAARAIGQGTSSIHSVTHSLGLFFYAAAAIAYDRLGFEASETEYDQITEEVCAEYTATLQAISIENEPNPAKCNWHC